MTTFRRRLVRLLPRLGLRVLDVWPGAVIVTRSRRRVQVRDIGADTVLLTRSRRGVEVRDIGAGTVLLTPSRRKIDVREISPGTTLVTEPAVVRRHRHEHDKELSAHLLTSLLRDVLSRYRVNVVLDVGANKGQYARSLRRAGYRGRIISFEPVPGVFQELERRAADDPAWTVHQLALGSEDGAIEMNVVPGTLSSVLPPSDFGARRYEKLQAATVEKVPLRRLDGILDELLADVPDPRPYLKLDTQGFDLEAFAGLGDRAKDVVGMQSEVALMQIYEGMPRLADSLAAYEAAGFEVAGFYPVTRERRTARVLEFDCVLVRAAALPGT